MSSMISFSFDYEAMDRVWVVDAITAQEWGAKRSRQDVEHALSTSTICGAFYGIHQVGFIRAVTDERFFGYIGDLIVAEEYRLQGVGTRLVEQLLRHPECVDVSNWMTTTRSAAAFFERLGFKPANSDTNLVAKRHGIKFSLASGH